MIGTIKAAELLGICDRRVRKLIAEGRVYGACKIGGSWVIPTVNGYPQIKTASRGPKPTWKKVQVPAKNIIHINRQLIGTKMDDGKFSPPISVKYRNENTYSRRVAISGPCVLVYDFENPQSNCSATAWLETFSEVEITDGCIYEEIIKKNPKSVKPKSRKASKKGFGLETDFRAVA